MGVMFLIVLGASLVANVVLACLMVVARLRNRKLLEDDLPRALPPTSSLSLKERMAELGMGFHRHPEITYISEDIRGDFIKTGSGEAICRRCHNYVEEVHSKNPAVNPCDLGCFCTNCGEGRLFASIGLVRKENGLPPLPDHNLFAVLKVLERYALEKGIIQPRATERPALAETSMFSAVIQNSGDYRKGPLKVRVDVKTQTVALEDETSQSSQALRLIK